MAINGLLLESFNLIFPGPRCLHAMQMLDWGDDKDEKLSPFSLLIDKYLLEGGDTRSLSCKTICSYRVIPAR